MKNESITRPVVISLGGSLFVPDNIDVEFLKNFKSIIVDEVNSGRHFIIIAGGGKTCRNYQNAVKELTDLTNEDLDWIGIYSTRFHAHVMRYVFKGLAHEEIIIDPSKVGAVEKPIVIGAGWKPGWSTDYDAVDVAKSVGVRKLLNLSNIDYIYNKDPKKYSDAKKIEDITWKEYRKLIPAKWSAGLNTPFGPIASKNADEMGIEVTIINGTNLVSFKNYLEGKSFQGTTIHS